MFTVPLELYCHTFTHNSPSSRVDGPTSGWYYVTFSHFQSALFSLSLSPLLSSVLFFFLLLLLPFSSPLLFSSPSLSLFFLFSLFPLSFAAAAQNNSWGHRQFASFAVSPRSPQYCSDFCSRRHVR